MTGGGYPDGFCMDCWTDVVDVGCDQAPTCVSCGRGMGPVWWSVANYDVKFGPFASYEEAEQWCAKMGQDRSLLWHPIIYKEERK